MVLDTETDHSKNSQDRENTISGLIYEAQVYQVLPSGTDDATIATSHKCWYLEEAINSPSVKYPLTEKDLKFLGG